MGKEPTDDDFERQPTRRKDVNPLSRRHLLTWLGILSCALLLLIWYSWEPALHDKAEVAGLLPDGITLDDVAEYRRRIWVPSYTENSNSWAERNAYRYITVEQKLAGVGAHVVRGKLLDSQGREIRFFKGYGGGVPPSLEWQDQRRRELDYLEVYFTVIKIAGNDPRYPPP